MQKKLAWMTVFALTLGLGNAWAEDHEGEADENAAFGAEVAEEAKAGGVDGQSVAERARALRDGETTIDVMDESDAETSEAVTQDLPDPEELPDEAAFGQGVAADARDGGVDGAEIAADARDMAGEMAGEGSDSLEAPGRSDEIPDVPDLPEQVPPDVPAGP